LLPSPRSVRATPRPASTSWAFAPFAALQGRTLRLWLPREVRAVEGPNGRDWRVKARGAKDWRRLVDEALQVLEHARPRWQRATVHYAFYGRREIDPDNLVGLGKPILDGLVGAGVLPDDRREQILAAPTAIWSPTPLAWGFVVVAVERHAAR
jgi:hypothetical protein